MAHKLVLIRHGESVWNELDRFTGWSDVALSPDGVNEAKQAGILLKEEGFSFDHAYTSVLTRAIKTLQLALEQSHMTWIPVTKHWRLNERHYGGLQGRNKEDTREDFGEEAVHSWRRAFMTRPPMLSQYDSRSPGRDLRYQGIDESLLPLGESLKDTLDRVLPYWEDELKPAILEGKKLIIAAHGNSLRALAKNLENLTDEQVVDLEIPTGKPLVYELDEQDLSVIRRYYLHDKDQKDNSWFSFFNRLNKKS